VDDLRDLELHQTRADSQGVSLLLAVGSNGSGYFE
jgi:hypothetical protein